MLASASSDHTVRLWDVKTGAPRATLEGHNASTRAVAFSPGGGTLASAAYDNTVQLWDVSNFSLDRKIKTTAVVTELVFSGMGEV